MANIKSTHLMPGNDRTDEDDAFGWQLYHDRQRNLIYYLHSYTGEVRWPRPETVGFVMHGLKPLPAHADTNARTDSRIVNPDIWSPYYPHVVMLPSGLVQVHPASGLEAQGATEMWCGYNRFPLTDIKAKGATSKPHRTNELNGAAVLATEPRILPPTWEKSRSGSPFLPPYPVAVLKRDDAENKYLAKPCLHRLEERSHTPTVDTTPSYPHELNRVQSSMEWSTVISKDTTIASIPKQRVIPKESPAPNTVKKEHNRKGYLLRQARKMMREGNSSSSTATLPSTSKQRKNQEAVHVPAPPRLERPLKDNQDKHTTYRDICRWAVVQTREKITVPAAGGEVRRRRLKSKLSKDKFTALSTEFLDRVQTAMQPLHPPINDEFQLQRDGNGALVIRTNAQEFAIKVLSSKQQIEFLSPVSGLRTYCWNAMTKRWEDETDSHDIEGLLTRDLMRFCAGMPLF